jgi:uncharacterized membrane protein
MRDLILFIIGSVFAFVAGYSIAKSECESNIERRLLIKEVEVRVQDIQRDLEYFNKLRRRY